MVFLRKYRFFLVIFFLFFPLHAHNLLDKKIRKIPSQKRNVFWNKGIFHNGDFSEKTSLKGLRHGLHEGEGFERLVMDFKGRRAPRIYGYLSSEERKIYVDLFNTSISEFRGLSGLEGRYITSINVFPIYADMLSVEIALNKEVTLDIFCLENPGRLVLDIKG